MKGSATVTLCVLPSHALRGAPVSTSPVSAPPPPIAASATSAPPAPLVLVFSPAAPAFHPPLPAPPARPEPDGPGPIGPEDTVEDRAPPVAAALPNKS